MLALRAIAAKKANAALSTLGQKRGARRSPITEIQVGGPETIATAQAAAASTKSQEGG